jgi:CxxC-x17-CxxC domain-containing protein
MKKFDNIFNNEKRNNSREGDFKRRDSGGRRDSGRRSFGGDRERPQMHEAICSDCGKRCEVPFKPTGDKPVYCSQCFTNHGGASRSDGPERGGRERSSFRDRGDRPMFSAICDTCGKRFELPFRPTGEKPVYCNDCFDKEGGSKSNNRPAINQNKEQFDMLNAKLDRLIKLLTPTIPVKEEKKEVVIEKKEVATKKKKEIKKPSKVVSKKPVSKKKKAK